MTAAVTPPDLDVRWSRSGLVLPLLLAACVVGLIFPLPAWLLDMAISANIAAAVLMLLTTLAVRQPLEFSVFPSLLLVTTLCRLVLNIASTRLILTEAGHSGTGAAGEVIEAFGQFMAGGQLAIGLALFLILLVIQFIVINQGTTRIGEVSARFVLDALPGRQMAIDADLQSGSIAPQEAAYRRQQLTRQADFYGAMDGASRFVKGDALASLVITAINLVGGLCLGIFQHDLPLHEAIEVYSQLTIGDGLVTQLPAFLISLAAALLTTRSSVESDLSGQVVSEVFLRTETLLVAAILLAGLGFTGLPRMPLFGLAGCLALTATQIKHSKEPSQIVPGQQVSPAGSKQVGSAGPGPKVNATTSEDKLFAEPLELELGLDLLAIASAAAPCLLLDRLAGVRSELALTMGTLLPRVKIRDNLELGRQDYRIRIHEVAVARGTVQTKMLLAVPESDVLGPIAGIPTIDPATEQDALWIDSARRDRAEVLGYTVLDPAEVISRHISAVTRAHSAELLSRQQVHQLIEALRTRAPRLVDELVPSSVAPGLLHQVLCRLLSEQVPIRNLEVILETLGDRVGQTSDLTQLTELVRQGLARTICHQYRDAEHRLWVITLDAALEARLAQAYSSPARRPPPEFIDLVLRRIRDEADECVTRGLRPVVLTTSELRSPLHDLTATSLPHVVILSTAEITRDTQLELVGQVIVSDLDTLRGVPAELPPGSGTPRAGVFQ